MNVDKRICVVERTESDMRTYTVNCHPRWGRNPKKVVEGEPEITLFVKSETKSGSTTLTTCSQTLSLSVGEVMKLTGILMRLLKKKKGCGAIDIWFCD